MDSPIQGRNSLLQVQMSRGGNDDSFEPGRLDHPVKGRNNNDTVGCEMLGSPGEIRLCRRADAEEGGSRNAMEDVDGMTSAHAANSNDSNTQLPGGTGLLINRHGNEPGGGGLRSGSKLVEQHLT